MTAQTTLTDNRIDPATLAGIAAAAGAVDRGEQRTRTNLVALAGHNVLDLGAPDNADGALPAMAGVIGELAGTCLATAFSTWAQRMTIEYLAAADTDFARAVLPDLVTAAAPGVTGMASAFKTAAGCGTLDLRATPTGSGYLLDGTLRWASNLYPDAVLVTAAETAVGGRIVVALPLSAPGVHIGAPFDLLALGATASSSLRLDAVHISTAQVLTGDFTGFLGRVRPTFLILQTALCLGLARRCADAAGAELTGVNSAFADHFATLTGDLDAAEAELSAAAHAVGSVYAPQRRRLLKLRLAAAELAATAAALEVRTAGGRGYARHTDASRRFREAAFLPVQSPSEAQLRWELGRDD